MEVAARNLERDRLSLSAQLRGSAEQAKRLNFWPKLALSCENPIHHNPVPRSARARGNAFLIQAARYAIKGQPLRPESFDAIQRRAVRAMPAPTSLLSRLGLRAIRK